jgi:Fe-Mn family superoxide dismutase
MQYQLPDLPYPHDALEPVIDAETMRIHHEKHHGGYVNKLNKAIEGIAAPENVRELIGDLDAVPAERREAVRNNGGGHANHSLFWTVMRSPGSPSTPAGELKDAIQTAFGGIDKLRDLFTETAKSRFGSGWAWLCVHENGELFVCSTPNQDNPLMRGYVERPGIPILGLDVWEHAYYLLYQNRRADYINAWWDIVNWERVAELHAAAQLVAAGH